MCLLLPLCYLAHVCSKPCSRVRPTGPIALNLTTAHCCISDIHCTCARGCAATPFTQLCVSCVARWPSVLPPAHGCSSCTCAQSSSHHAAASGVFFPLAPPPRTCFAFPPLHTCFPLPHLHAWHTRIAERAIHTVAVSSPPVHVGVV